MTEHEHHDHEQEGTHGMALGFRILDEGGKLYLAEAEISPYVDEPNELGATLVFHPLDGLNPVEEDASEWPAWSIDIDDELERDGSQPIPQQFIAIARQLHGLSEQQLRDYLAAARAEEES